MPFVVHGGLAFLAIVPSFFLVRESAPIANKRSTRNKEDQINTRALLAMMLEAKYLGFLSAQFFASMTRGVLWGGTLLLYAAYAYGAGPQLLGGLATTTSIVGIPITISCGYLMDRFGRKTTMVPGFVSIALGLMFLASGAQWHWSLASFVAGFLWIHGGHSVTSGSMLQYFVGSYPQLLAARVVIDAGSSPQHPLGSSILSRYYPKARGWALTFHHSAGNLGSFLGPALASLALLYMGWRTAFVVFGIFSLAMGLTLFLLQDYTSASDEAAGKKSTFKANLNAYIICLKNRNILLTSLVLMVGAAGRGTGVNATYLVPFFMLGGRKLLELSCQIFERKLYRCRAITNEAFRHFAT